MINKKDSKERLFEVMQRVAPNFNTKPLNEEKEDKKWIQKAVDPEHKGFCSPMTKPTCTPKRKALAKTFKKGIDEKSVLKENEELEGASYKAKLEELVELAKTAYENLPEGELPSWVSDKIVIAKEHLNDINEWLHGEEEEEEGNVEGPNREMDAEEEPETSGEEEIEIPEV